MRDFFRAAAETRGIEWMAHIYALAIEGAAPALESEIWAGIAEIWEA